MYENPITVYAQEISNHMAIERENIITAKISETIGININREELIEALNYDRNQYEKGYADAKAEYEPKWTRVEDGLPDLHDDERLVHRKRSDEVLCKIKDGEDVINSCGYLVENIDEHKEWQTDCYLTVGVKVIAWMPIPKYEEMSE